MKRQLHALLVAAALGAGAGMHPAFANDGGIAFGGTPKLLDGHPSVRMESEVIRMNIGAASVRTTCDFTFVNGGKTCRVRMGFPDQGEGVDDPDEEAGPDVMRQPPHTTFTSFISYVDSKEAATKLIRSDRPGQYWHTKTVTFPAHRRVHIRDIYSQPVSGSIAFKGSYKSVRYIVHTGSSWHGSIGHSTLLATFRQKNKSHLTARPAGSRVGARDWTKAPAGEVLYTGFGTPTVLGHTLRFERRNWRPSGKDDLTLYFRD